MAANQELYELVMRLNPGSTAADVQRLLNELARQSKSIDLLDPAQVDAFGAKFKEMLAKVSESGQLSKISEQLQKGIASGSLGGTKFLTEAANEFGKRVELEITKAIQRAATNSSKQAFITRGMLGLQGPAAEQVGRVSVRGGQPDLSGVAGLRSQVDLAKQEATYEAALRGLTNSILREIGAINKDADSAQKSAEARAKASFAESQRIYRIGLDQEAAEKAAAEQASQRAAALQEINQRRVLPYGSPNTLTPLGRAQEQANKAAEDEARARARIAAEEAKAVPSVDATISADRALRTALESRASAEKRIAALSEAPPTGLASQFALGFRGRSGDPYAVQLGQAAKFSLLYGSAYKALFLFTQTLQQTLQEGIQFEQAVTELKLATGQSASSAKDLANQLGQQAAAAGFAPSEGALAGARSVGLYGASGSDAATQDTIARISTDVATKLAFNSGMQISDVQTSLAAITNAFQLGYAGQGQIADLDAYFSHKFGVAPGQTIQSVAEAGSVAKQAGFSLDQTQAIAALLQGRTGQSADAVAGYMAQIFSRGGEGSLSNVASKYGIRSTETLQKQLAELAKVYKTASPNEQNQIAAAFGRGKVQNAVSVLLGSFDEVSRAAKQAGKDVSQGGAKGAADAAFNERINNLGGQLQLLLASFKEFANLLGQSGVLSGLGLMAEVLKKLLDSANALLSVWDRVPGVMKDALGALVLYTLATRTAAGQSLISGTLGSQAVSGALAARGLAPVTALSTGRTALANEAGAIVPIRTGAGAIGRGVLASAAPWIGAIGGLYALGQLTGAANSLNDSMKAASDALLASTKDLVTPDQWRNRAALLQKQSDSLGPKGFWENAYSALTFGQLPGRVAETQGRLNSAAAFDQSYARALAKQEQAANSGGPAKLITSFDPTSLNSSMQELSSSGRTAQQVFGVLRDSILATASAADRARASFSADTFSKGIAASIADQQNQHAATVKDNKHDAYKLPDVSFSGASYVQQVQDAVKSLGIDTTNLSKNQITKLTKSIVDRLSPAVGPDASSLAKQLSTDTRAMFTRLVTTAIEGQTKTITDLLRTAHALNGEEMASFYTQLNQNLTAALAALPTTDYAGRSALIRQRLRTVLQRIAKNLAAGGHETAQDQQEVDALKAQLVQSQITQLENLRRAAQQAVLGNRAAVARIGKSFFQREVKAALSAGKAGQDALVAIVQEGGAAEKNAVIGMVQEQIATIEAIQKTQRLAVQAALGAINPLLGLLAGVGGDSPEVKQLKGVLAALHGTTHGATDTFATGSDVPGYKPPTKPPKVDRQAQIQKMLAIRASLRQLSIDMTDPLAEARVAVADALDRVKHAINREDRLAAEVDLRKARSDLEATKFQQRLQSVQTADDLGRISHLKYIAYLDHEHDRLNAIKHRTYQQQQELDQVDELLKSAQQSLEGQWNFGNISLPTPYQVKRRVEELFGPAVGHGSVAGTSVPGALPGSAGNPQPRDPGPRGPRTVIYVDGADVAKVRAIIREEARGDYTVASYASRRR